MKLMIVDDEADMEALFKQRFRKQIKSGEIEYFFASDGKSAMNSFSSDQFQSGDDKKLVLIDYNLPDISGIELMKKMKDFDPGSKFYIVSGMTDDSTRGFCLRCHVAGFIDKPIDFDKLTKIFEEF